MTSEPRYLAAGRQTTVDSGMFKLRAESSSLRPLVALVADDETNNHDLYEAVLREHGINNIEFAENGQEALDAARKRRPDIVFLDTNMPMMEGYEACRQLRASYGQDLRIVGMSSQSPNQTLWEGVGADHYFDKDVLCGISRKENLGTHLSKMFPQYFNK